MPTHTIKPAGGGDYTTLQAWETAVDGMAADTYIAECYSGGDLGQVVFDTWTNTSIGKITTPAAQGHGGDATVGAYIQGTGTAITCTGVNFEIQGLRILGHDNNGSSVGIDQYTASATARILVVDGCLIVCNATTGKTGARFGIYSSFEPTTTQSITISVRNCIFKMALDTALAHVGVALESFFGSGSGTATHTANIHNNTLVTTGTSATVQGLSVSRYALSGKTLNMPVTVRNNVHVANTCFVTTLNGGAGPGSLTITSSNNASSDGTASSWGGGSGHVTSLVAANHFMASASNWSLKAGSSLLETGFDLSGTFTNDAYGNTRVAPFNIGAWEGIVINPPVANFSGTPLSDVVPLTVVFTDSSSNTPTSWLWDFGDASSDTVQNPSHTYLAEGTYTVTLTATNAGGSDGETKAAYIIVLPATPDAAVRIGLGLRIGL